MRTLHLLTIVVLFQLAIPDAAAQTSVGIGDYRSHSKGSEGIEIKAENAVLRITPYADDVLRVRIARERFSGPESYAVSAKPDGAFLRVEDAKEQLTLVLPGITLSVAKKPLRLTFLDARGRVINADDPALGVSWLGTDVSRYMVLHGDERFLGLGEKTGPLDRRGRSYVNWNSDRPAYGEEDDPIYATVPFYIGVHDSLAYGIFFDNTRRTRFDFGASTDGRTASYGAPDGEMNYYVFAGPTVARVIEQYTALTGRAPLPPLWSLGYQQCRYSYYPDTEVLNIARTFRQKKIPCDVIYLDIHYMDAYKIFSWHPERFPDPKRLIDSLRAMNFHVVTIVDPGIKIEDGYASYEEGKKQGLFARYPGGDFYTGSVWPGRCHFPDFTSAKTRDWWGRSFAKLVDPGVEGFWNDMNEPAVWGQSIPDLVQFAFEGDTASMREAHNVYGMQMARATYEGTKKLLKRRPFVLTRAGYAGLQRYTAIWTGDNLASDGHMLLATRLVNSLGLSGIPFCGPDIGGFIGDPGRDLFSRWITIGTYTPLFRNHKCYGAKRQEPWSLGEDVETLCRQTIDERYRLLPYLYTAFSQATATGIPIARSLAIDWTFDRNVYDWKFQNQYLLGAHLLVAPVSSNEQIARVYLPPTSGGWYKMNNDERYTQTGVVKVDAPIYDLPVFVRAGAVLPLQRAVQHTAEKVDTLELHVYAGPAETQSLYYEDDGSSDAYRDGSFHRRVLRATPGSVLLERATGTSVPRHSAIRFVFHGFETEPSLTINDAPVACTPVPGWTQPRFEAHAAYSSDAMVLRYKAYR